MALKAGELIDWLSCLDEDEKVMIDEGGLALQVVDDSEIYIEVGGAPEEGEDRPTDDELGIGEG